jgi:hypothetical protein
VRIANVPQRWALDVVKQFGGHRVDVIIFHTLRS